MKVFYLFFSLFFLTSCEPVKPVLVGNTTFDNVTNYHTTPYDEYKNKTKKCLNANAFIEYKSIDLKPNLTAVVGFDRLAIDLYRHNKIENFKNILETCFSETIDEVNYQYFKADSTILTKEQALSRLHIELQEHQDKLIKKFTSYINKNKINKQGFDHIEQCHEHAKAMIEDKIENKNYSPNIREYYDDCLKEITKFKGKP